MEVVPQTFNELVPLDCDSRLEEGQEDDEAADGVLGFVIPHTSNRMIISSNPCVLREYLFIYVKNDFCEVLSMKKGFCLLSIGRWVPGHDFPHDSIQIFIEQRNRGVMLVSLCRNPSNSQKTPQDSDVSAKKPRQQSRLRLIRIWVPKKSCVAVKRGSR